MKTAVRSITNAKVQPVRYPELAKEISVRLPGGVTYPAGQLLKEDSTNAAQSEVQTLTITATVGTYRLSWTGFGFTVPLAFNAANAAVQAAIDTVLGSGNCVVTGANSPYTLTYAAEFANRDVELLTIDTSALTFTVATITQATQGSVGKVGGYSAYSGTGTAKAILGRATKTDARCAIIDEFGNTNNVTTSAWNAGDFLVSDLTGVDAAALAARFVLVDGGTSADTGAVVRLQ